MTWRPITLDDADEVRSRVAEAMRITIGEVDLTFHLAGPCCGISMPRDPSVDLGEWERLEAHGVRLSADGVFEMLNVCALPSDVGFVPAEPVSCATVPTSRCASCPRSVVEIKAKLVLALRYDRHAEVASLRVELAEARAAASAKVEE